LKEDRLAVSLAAEADTRTSDEPDHLHHPKNSESATENDDSRMPNLQNDLSAPCDESHNSDQETSAGDESASETLSEKTYSSHSSQQSINYPRTTTSEPHNSIWRNEEIIDEECLSLLTPEPQWRRLFHPRRKDATLPAHQKAQSNSSQEITHNVTWHKLDQRPSSPVLVQPDTGLQLACLSGQKLTIDSLDEHRDHCMREDRKRESIVHDWVFRHPPLIHDFPPHTDHSTSQDPKAPFPVDRHSATEFAPGRPDAGPARRETPTDDRYNSNLRRTESPRVGNLFLNTGNRLQVKTPNLLERVEDRIRRLILPEMDTLKEAEKSWLFTPGPATTQRR
jgi:hypothetical protein